MIALAVLGLCAVASGQEDRRVTASSTQDVARQGDQGHGNPVQTDHRAGGEPGEPGSAEHTNANGTFLCQDCNVILIALTNLRYDHVSGNGYARPTTPHLDALADESLVFDNAFSHSSWTLPEGVSLLTSQYPYQHGVMNRFDGFVLPADSPTLMDVLGAHGYRTAAFTGGFDYDPVFGLTTRFGLHQQCAAPGAPEGEGYGELACTVPKAIEWIEDHRDARFFVFVQGYDLHCPYSQRGGGTYDGDYQGSIDFSTCLWTFDRSEPVVKDGRTYYPIFSPSTAGHIPILLGEDDLAHLIALYDESITFADAQLGLLLAAVKRLGLDERTILIVTAEHGEMLGKHGRFMRGGPLWGTFYDDVLHVPLIVRHPHMAPARIEGLVEQIDVMPTLLDALSLLPEVPLQGTSLFPLMTDHTPVHHYVFAGSEYRPGAQQAEAHEPMRAEAIRSRTWKLIRETRLSHPAAPPHVEFYDLTNDQEELRSLTVSLETSTGPVKDAFEELQRRLTAWSEGMGAGGTQRDGS